jgi:hypothetical protein
MSVKFPEFETDRLFLRGVTAENAYFYTKYFIDYEVISQLTANVPWPYPPWCRRIYTSAINF